MATKMYLDTWLLRAMISGGRGYGDHARDMVSRLRLNSYDVIIPQIVLGEAFATIMRDYDDPNDAHNILSKLYDKLMLVVEAGSCIPPLSTDIVEKAKELKGMDSHLRDTDAIIVAQALLDPDSQGLLTADTALIRSEAIKDEEKRMRGAGQRNYELRIADSL